jgi:hypothetical protein
MAHSIFGTEEYPDAALEFAKVCLLQPESYLEPDSFRVQVRPDGFNSGPEPFCDMTTLAYDSVEEVLMVVTYWCQLNDIALKIEFTGGCFVCTFIEGTPVNQVLETRDHMNLCWLLLEGAVAVAQHMKHIEPPRASMRASDFRKSIEE